MGDILKESVREYEEALLLESQRQEFQPLDENEISAPKQEK